ncbi:hypothetical protein L9F63_013299, partial [Diploptera punctata]
MIFDLEVWRGMTVQQLYLFVTELCRIETTTLEFIDERVTNELLKLLFGFIIIFFLVWSISTT